MMLGSIRREYTSHARVKATAKDSRKTGSLESFLIGPLPAILKLCFIQRLIVRRIKVVHTCLETRIHDV